MTRADAACGLIVAALAAAAAAAPIQSSPALEAKVDRLAVEVQELAEEVARDGGGE